MAKKDLTLSKSDHNALIHSKKVKAWW